MVKVIKMCNVQLQGDLDGKFEDNSVTILINPDHIITVESFTLTERKKDENIKHEAVRVYLNGNAPQMILLHSFDDFCREVGWRNPVEKV